MRSYRLSPQAELSLEEIIGWTVENFGVDQVFKYKDQLRARLSALAANEAPRDRACNVLLAGKRDANDLEYYRVGRHYMIYGNPAEAIFVIDFVHGSRNLEAIIDDLSVLS